MASFELWLDESGNFINEGEKNGCPSLVGGILIPKDRNNGKWVQNIIENVKQNFNIKGKTLHGTEIKGQKYGEMAVTVLEAITMKNGQLVVFENAEKVDIVSSDLTYLNLMSEGIIQLLQTLSVQHDDIHLEIIAANRVKVDGMEERKELSLIKGREYIERLEEKIALGLARRNLTKKKKWNWDFKLDSARSNECLMIADIVCHSWFVRHGSKFSEDARTKLWSLYDSNYYFSLFEHATKAAIERLVTDGLFGNALFEWLESYTSTKNDREDSKQAEIDFESLLEMILTKLADLPEPSQATQLSLITNQVETLIEVDRDFHQALNMLMTIKEMILPYMEKLGIKHFRFSFQIHIHILIIANHRGHISLANEQIDAARRMLEKLVGRWETINDVLGYMILESVHFTNIYHFEGTITSMDKVESFINNMFEYFSIGLLDNLSVLTEEMKSSLKGKIVGTRLQARTFLIHQDPSQIDYARQDSDIAMAEFVGQADLNRQYQYRSQIECEAGEIKEALKWLGKSFALDFSETVDIPQLAQSISRARYIERIFGAMHYSRTMCKALVVDEIQTAEMMYAEWIKAKMDEILFQEKIMEHPFEIILWKHAYFLSSTNRIKAGIQKYDEAIEICNYKGERLTLRSIALGIACEKAAVLLKAGEKYAQDAKKAKRDVLSLYKVFVNEHLPDQMREYFLAWEQQLEKLDQLEKTEASDLLMTLSRKIPY